MHFYDITVPISPSLAVYPGDPVIEIAPIAQITAGDVANVSRVVLSSHSGTHIDAPRHFFPAGAGVDTLDLHRLIGHVRVYELHQSHHITAQDLHALPLTGVQRILLKTSNSMLWNRPGFQTDYIALTESAAQFLLDHAIQLVGIDYLSVDAFTQEDFPVHRLLLAAGVIILEGLNLHAVPPGDYELIALPLLLEHGDGAPARAILRPLISSLPYATSTTETQGHEQPGS